MSKVKRGTFKTIVVDFLFGGLAYNISFHGDPDKPFGSLTVIAWVVIRIELAFLSLIW